MNLMSLIGISLAVAVIARTVTAEEIFRPLREWSKERGRAFYPLSCSFCFSFYVTALSLLFTRSLASFFPLIALANLWLALYDFQMIKTKLARENVTFAGEQVKAQRMANELGEINLQQTRELHARVSAHNANIDAEQTASSFAVGKRPN